jgi:hypothetical protein
MDIEIDIPRNRVVILISSTTDSTGCHGYSSFLILQMSTLHPQLIFKAPKFDEFFLDFTITNRGDILALAAANVDCASVNSNYGVWKISGL